MLSDGANPNAIDPGTNGTALMIAATVGQVYVLSLLLDAGAIIDQTHPDFGMTALLWACNNSHVRCAELLIEAGADKKATELSGLDGRELATENMRLGWEEIVDMLSDEDSDATDFATERALSAARTKRMAKIAGGYDHSSMSLLQTSEQLDKGPSKAAQKTSLLSTMKEAEIGTSLDMMGAKSADGESEKSLRKSQRVSTVLGNAPSVPSVCGHLSATDCCATHAHDLRPQIGDPLSFC